MNNEKNPAPQDAPRNKSKIAEREEEILEFWKENKIFDKSLEKPAPKGEFVFYDGPPFATGLPHYGHILPGTIKDVIPRYKTMRGYHVARRWGWDTHGLPIENLIEKELGLSSKKDIEVFGVEKFNNAARAAVMRYANEWKKIIPRVGRWVDMENDYKTLDTPYTESVWWAFKNLYDKGLVYKSFKVMYLCPHCETTLSNFEVNQGYKDITDISVYIKFKVVDEDNTYFLAWTTTPWTLPGNVALAVNKETTYVKAKKNGEFLVLAKDLAEKVLKEGYEITEEFSGKKLLGKSYEPIFPYYNNDQLENRKNGFKVYHGDFVTTVDGTGIVHIAPAFGEDDMNLGKIEKLPFVQHVNVDGTFKEEVIDFAGQKVKPKGDHQKADIEVIKFLAKDEVIYEKEKIIHSYPHCWRCDTPLLNYATTSWFINVSSMREKLLDINKGISWHPEEIGSGRFGKWLDGARDWAISRSRYWGAALPVWENGDKKLFVVGSIEELKKLTKKSGNRYFVMRHGEAEENQGDLVNSDIKNVYHLTKEGEDEVKMAAQDLKNKKIDLIISSPFERCKETAELVRKALGLGSEAVVLEEKLGEFRAGEQYEGKTWAEYIKFFKNTEERFEKAPEGGETIWESVRRAGRVLYGLEKGYSDKNILIVTHEGVINALHMAAQGADLKEAVKIKEDHRYKYEYAEVAELPFVPLPHDDNYTLNLHRPYIDDLVLETEDGRLLKRVPEVFDCWLESGSMPFAQVHYPFENKKEFEEGIIFPADFIAEGLDQTRGWFYTLLVLGAGVFGNSPYKSVVVNGLILAEDGRKMSKSLNNYPDIMYIVDKYGADSLRYYFMSSPAVKAEDVNFSERGVDEISKKVILKVQNVLSFYEMYTNNESEIRNLKFMTKNVLDKWILVKLNKLGEEVTKSLEKYDLDKASRPILDFIDDLSTWYIRRSRDRFKSEDAEDRKNALGTTRFVLVEMAKYMAPFTPFFAEHIYLALKGDKDPESVHLCDWPEAGKIDQGLLDDMEEARKVVSLALEKRMAAGIKVRQPLQKLKIKRLKIENWEEYKALIKDEVNVEQVEFSDDLEEGAELDTEITPGLQKKGNVREFIRAIQELRKKENLKPSDMIEIFVDTVPEGWDFLDSVRAEIEKPTNSNIKNNLEIKFESNVGEEFDIGKIKYKISIKPK